ncbi:MAG: hypothetical protein M3Q07_19835 [Pseudobdellovibrionaceae bacterium]|nr:hypothetical protein [Pseudobdellovibrionaceae bacterium]
MLVEMRNPELKYPRAIRAEKVRIVLLWLAEFRFSTLEILSKRLGLELSTSRSFFLDLIRENVLDIFENPHTRGVRYVMIGAAGREILSARYGVSNVRCKAGSLATYTSIIHDLAIQELVLAKIGDFSEVIWDQNIAEHCGKRPDALVKYPKGYWLALEFERVRKNKPRIYTEFQSHVEAIRKGLYAGIYYVFFDPKLKGLYKAHFDEVQWPTYVHDRKQAKFRLSDEREILAGDDVIRKCFIFTDYQEYIEIRKAN